MNHRTLQGCLEGYDRYVWCYPGKRHLREPGREILLEGRQDEDEQLPTFSFSIREGECLTLQAGDGQVLEKCTMLLTGEHSYILMDGKKVRPGMDRETAVVAAEATETMIFPEMSYMDNLCMGLARRMPDVWRSRRIFASIRREYAHILGAEVFDRPIEELSQRQKYQLIYTRIALQKPRVAFLIQPFMGADMPHRRFIWEMLEQLLDKGIALVLLSVNPLDAWLVAQRTLKLESRGILDEKRELEEHKIMYSFMNGKSQSEGD